MKKNLLLGVLGLLATTGVFYYFFNPAFESLNRPELQGENHADKKAPWTEEQAQKFYQEQELLRQGSILPPDVERGESSGYANGNLHGYWKSRGPHNMPGAFQFCEMDEGTDTIYAVTCGHYGGVQFVWKGTLWGDSWTTITPKHPARYEDVIVVPNGNKRRVILGLQGGDIMYSDDAGKNWVKSTGLPAVIHSTILSRQDNVIYAVSNNKVFKSTNNATSFTEVQTFGSSVNNSRLYSPRWSHQPGYGEVYLVRNNVFFKLNGAKTSFTQQATLSTSGFTINRIAISGDTRRLWVVFNEERWYSSTNGGSSFNFMPTTGYWYSDPHANMSAGQFIGINPENPNILIGGYAVPLISKDAGVTTIFDANKWWGYYQNAVNNDNKVRIHYHPDFQSNQFFYDKDNKLITLRSSDGGMFISYNEWLKNGFPNYSDIEGVYYNISLFGQPTQETYRGGFIYGHQHPDHLTAGTQDQGWQNTRPSTYGQENLSWNQIQGGDGPCCITGDGKIGWSYNYQGTGEFRRFPLYNGSNYVGLQGTKTGPVDFSFTGSSYFTPSVGDWDNGERIWVLSRSLRRIVHSGGNITAKEDLFGTGNTFIQGLAQSRVNPNILYTMRNGIVYKSTNRGDSWTEIANASATGISGLNNNRGMGWSSPLDANIVLFATQSGTSVKTIFSTNGGVSWENVTGSGANLFPSAEVNGMAGSKNGKFVFASTSMGPYVFVVDEKKWYPLATDSNVPVFWGQIVYCVDYGDKEIVHFSTWGQGVWDFVIEENVMENDVAAIDLNIPTSVTCGANVNSTVTIRNQGTETLHSVNIKLYLNDVLESTQIHNTSLVKNATQVITLPSFTVQRNTKIKVILELPNGMLDESPSNNEIESLVISGGLIPQETISIVSFSTEETSGEGVNNGRAIHLLDGNPNTFWHAKWTGSGSIMPHEFVFDLGNTYNVGQIAWRNRSTNSNGYAQTANVYISEDGNTWGNPELISLSSVNSEQFIALSGNMGQFVKLEILSNFSGTNTAALAELNFYGCQATITSVANKEQPTVKIYPNPTIDFVNVEGDRIQLIELLNQTGQLMKQEQVNGERTTLDMSAYTDGIYFIRVSRGKQTTIHKIIKN